MNSDHRAEYFSRASHDSFVDLFSTFTTSSPGAVRLDRGDAILYVSGFKNSLLNGVLGPRFTRDNMATRVGEIMSYFEERRLPMTFFVGPGCTPTGLDEHLQGLGMTPGWARPGMARTLGDVRPREPPAGLSILPVEDANSLDVCGETFGRGFAQDAESAVWLRAMVVGYGFCDSRRWFVGYLEGRPVGTALLVLHKSIAGIYCVATLPEARGKGVGTALTWETMLEARESGHEFAVLQASKMGLPVYERLGFNEYCRIRAYQWIPG